MPSPSGEQFLIRHGQLSAVVTETGATLRLFRSGQRDVLWGFDEAELASGGRGQVLFPWPNRLEDGKYTFAGIAGVAALDEPEHHNAIHGLVRWQTWRCVEHTHDAVVMSITTTPQPAYPFRVTATLRFSVAANGLRIDVSVQNVDVRTAPFGIGFHPYLLPTHGVDKAALHVRAATRLVADERGLPVRTESNTLQDRELQGVVLDDCFTDLERDENGRWEVQLSSDRVVDIVWGDAAFTHVMCFTGDTLPEHKRRLAVAIEPMTCAPNALHTGEGIIALAPGAIFTAAWGITPGS